MGDYVVFHDVAWHGSYAIYFFVIGISAALFFFSALSWFREEFKLLRHSAFYVSFVLLVFGGLLLVGDLSQPLRFIYTMFPWYWNMTSPLTWGSIIIVLYGVVSVWYFLMMEANAESNVKLAVVIRSVVPDSMRANAESNAKLAAVIGSVLALALPVYTGFDLAVHQHRPVWNTPLMPVLFVALSLVSGAAVASLLARTDEKLLATLRQIMLWTAGASGVMLISLIIATAYGGSAEELTYMFMTSGAMGAVFIGLGVVVGTAAPIALLLAPYGRQRTGMMVASLLILVGGISLRYSILMAPQIVHTFFS